MNTQSEYKTPQYARATALFNAAYDLRHARGTTKAQLDEMDMEISIELSKLDGFEFPKSAALMFDARRQCFATNP